MSRAYASYKKKDGFLAASDDRKFLFWTPANPPNASPSLTLPIADITNLQQTPASSAKIALKVVVQPSGAKEAENHVFSFTSPSDARKEQEAITEILRNAISAAKSATVRIPAAPAAPSIQDDSGKSAAMAIAQAVSAGSKKTSDEWYDDNRLKSDLELQRSLLDADPVLRKRFEESLRDKPESLSISSFATQFWSSRLPQLRSHAALKAQTAGDYNVLPEVKFKRVPAEKEGEPDKVMLNLAKEQVKLIFKQYPVVREAYNDNVPQLDQNSFWARFFMSRLYKRLKGQKVTDQDPGDAVFDRYLDYQEKAVTNLAPVPHFIDLEGNEQNHSQRKGNRPDETMRPGNAERMPILRALNNLSEKLLSHMAPTDGEAHAPVGMDEGTFEELQLRDLQARDDDNRVKLNIKDQQRLAGGEEQEQLSADAIQYGRQSPKQVLADLSRDLLPTSLGQDGSGNLRLDKTIGVQEDSDDSDDEADGQTNGATSRNRSVRIGGSAALIAATGDMLGSIRLRRSAEAADSMGTFGLTQTTYDTLTMTHNTTIEFLHYFWTVFLSGDSARTNELAKLVETLDKSVDRINAVGSTAEQDRSRKIETLRKALETAKPGSTKRRRIELDIGGVEGGKKAVKQMVEPTMQALVKATSRYRKALEEQSAATA